ncbi:MAG: hypothetical protein M0Z84_15845 [Gammaproteobacteria bacterium]|nr:hypothetical protein [Gammaproteobacteria bacterium]
MKFAMLALALVGVVLSVPAFAQGDYVPGYVYVGPNSEYMYGTFNNRFNTTLTATKTYIGAGGYANGLLYFYGEDANGHYFYCYIPTTSPIYQAAVQIKNTLGNGSLLSVERTPPSSECTSVYSAKASHYLN